MFGNFGWTEMSYRKYRHRNNNERMIYEYKRDNETDELTENEIDMIITNFWDENETTMGD
jgi:hypothetical protein